MEELLNEYGASHRDPLNKKLHWACVPVIVWTVVALLWALPFPNGWQPEGIPLNWALIALVLAQVYYFRLSFQLGLGVLLFHVFLLWLTSIVDTAAPWPLWAIAVSLFIIAWIGQFIGHAIEGKRPSFFKDLQFLLVGPAWLMSFLYERLGLRY
ncbi:DUF962 domain-containing protein [Elongatibacter sediminis]|uniref:Mpo1-like protein n=1 Tax=Elongatibacter sediminis TaxID=3119006 RepID=A0AAW9RAN9_9GAMM